MTSLLGYNNQPWTTAGTSVFWHKVEGWFWGGAGNRRATFNMTNLQQNF